MDALPVTETDDEIHLPAREGFSSRREGRMHACGHDGHTAIGLAVAARLAASQNWAGTVKVVFQPAEEGGRGALRRRFSPDRNCESSARLCIDGRELSAATVSKMLSYRFIQQVITPSAITPWTAPAVTCNAQDPWQPIRLTRTCFPNIRNSKHADDQCHVPERIRKHDRTAETRLPTGPLRFS
jgi:hypothetical protein